jgi:class 3 adenylate cyclase
MAATITLMFTDLVGSTQLLGSLGEDGAADLRRRHFAVVREAVAAAGGHEVKSLGDGLMVAFESAAAGVACARDIQRRVAEAHGDVGVRIGLHAGEPDREEGDFFGTPVVVASRLCDQAGAGQIVASELVRGLVAAREGGAFRPLGALQLKGLPEPVSAWEIHWGDGAPPAAATGAPADLRAPLPPELVRPSAADFSGRADALARLRLELSAARNGLRVTLVSGEPGIGKTRLAAELAKVAHAEGAVVLFGRCDEEGLVPYQPFAEALRTYLAAVPGAAALATGMERLAGAVPVVSAGDSDPAAERLALFEAALAFFERLAAEQALVLVLDDLHWADGPTLALLRHLVRRGTGMPVLVVGTYRDTDLSRTHPLAASLAELRREHAIERLNLVGLDESEVALMLTAAAGHAPPAPFARALQRETEGNPFFIEEIVRHLIETGTIVQRDGQWTSDRSIEDMGIPEGVREAVGRRLAQLPETANRALTAAAVLGRRFEFGVLAEMAGDDEDSLLDALDAALQAQLVVDATEHGRPAYAFRHALVRETLYEELSLPRRQRHHLRAAEAIETVHARDLDPQAGVLALHLRMAGAAVDPRRALEWTLRAAGAAAAQLAWEECAAQLESALELMDDADVRPEERAAALERLADLRYVTNTDLEEGLRCLEEALQCYERAGLPERVARIHSRLARDRASYWGSTMDIDAAAAHLAAAEPVLGGADLSGSAAAFQLAKCTVALGQGDGHQGRAASRRAIEIGRSLQRPVLVLNAEILDAFLAGAMGEPGAMDRLDAAWQEADRRNHPWLAFLASWLAVPLSFWAGSPYDIMRFVQRELGRPRVASAVGQRRLLEHFRVQGLCLQGKLDEARPALAEFPSEGFEYSTCMHTVFSEDAETGLAAAHALFDRGVGEHNRWSQTVARHWIAHAAWGAGDVGTALEQGAASAADLDVGGLRAFSECEHAWLALRRAHAGDADGARESAAAARAQPGAGAPDGEMNISVGLRLAAAGAVAALDGDRPSAEAGFEAAVRGLERVGAGWLVTEVRRHWGSRLGRADLLESAALDYEAMGAGPQWAAGARADIAALQA